MCQSRPNARAQSKVRKILTCRQTDRQTVERLLYIHQIGEREEEGGGEMKREGGMEGMEGGTRGCVHQLHMYCNLGNFM